MGVLEVDLVRFREGSRREGEYGVVIEWKSHAWLFSLDGQWWLAEHDDNDLDDSSHNGYEFDFVDIPDDPSIKAAIDHIVQRCCVPTGKPYIIGSNSPTGRIKRERELRQNTPAPRTAEEERLPF